MSNPAPPSSAIPVRHRDDAIHARQRRQHAIKRGLKDAFPTIVGSMPFGMLVGSAATAAGMDPWLAMAMSVIVYAGASQLAAIQLMAQHAPALIVVATVLVVNLRFMLYSASLAPVFRHFPLGKRILFGYLITDHVFALVNANTNLHSPATSRAQDDSALDIPPYYLAITIAQWISWQITVAIGVFLGTLIPKDWSLDFAIPLVFIAIVIPALATRTHWVAAIAASIAALFTAAMPMKLGLIAAAFTGVIVGAWLESIDAKRSDGTGGAR
jgi:predicted branched-subunit amino acid permease